MRLLIAAIALAGVFGRESSAQSSSDPSVAASPVGVWRGTSVCLVRPSACNDENVVYRITQLQAADSLAIDARKIVHGAEEEMGVLACHLARATSQITCSMRQGVWHFRAANDSLTGELRLPDNTRYRDVRTRRVP